MMQGMITTLRPNLLSDILLGKYRVPSRRDGKIPHQLYLLKVLCGVACVNQDQATDHGKDPGFPRRVPKETGGDRESHVSSGFSSGEMGEILKNIVIFGQ